MSSSFPGHHHQKSKGPDRKPLENFGKVQLIGMPFRHVENSEFAEFEFRVWIQTVSLWKFQVFGAKTTATYSPLRMPNRRASGSSVCTKFVLRIKHPRRDLISVWSEGNFIVRWRSRRVLTNRLDRAVRYERICSQRIYTRHFLEMLEFQQQIKRNNFVNKEMQICLQREAVSWVSRVWNPCYGIHTVDLHTVHPFHWRRSHK